MIETGGPVSPHDEMIWGADCGEGEWGNLESEGESKEWRPIWLADVRKLGYQKWFRVC